MMKRNFGKFKETSYQMGGEVDAVQPNVATSNTQKRMRPVMGAPLPNPQMKQGVMGQISAPKETLSPQAHSGEIASRKRMQKMPNQSPLGPITGGPVGAPPQGPTQPGQQGVGSLGDRWMGEIWQQLSSEDPQPQPMQGMGYANGGSVGEAMSVYNQTMQDLESGGMAGYAHGGMVDQSSEIASMGRNGDSMLMHVNPSELQGLQSLLGPLSINPDTGNPEAFPWLIPLLGLAAGTIAGGAASDWEAGPMIGGALAGLTLGGLGAAAAPAAGAAAGGTGGLGALLGTAAPGAAQVPLAAAGAASAAPVIGSALGGAGIGAGALAPGAGVLASGLGGGLTAGQVAAAGGAPTVSGTQAVGAGMQAGASPGGISSVLNSKGMGLAKKGMGMLSKPSQPQQRMAPAPPPPPAPKKPWTPPRIPGRSPVQNFQKRLPGAGIIGGLR